MRRRAGTISPTEFGPITLAPDSRASVWSRIESWTGVFSVTTTIKPIAASAASATASSAASGGTYTIATSKSSPPVPARGRVDRVEHRHAVNGRPACRGVTPAVTPGAIGVHVGDDQAGLAPGDALDEDARRLAIPRLTSRARRRDAVDDQPGGIVHGRLFAEVFDACRLEDRPADVVMVPTSRSHDREGPGVDPQLAERPDDARRDQIDLGVVRDVVPHEQALNAGTGEDDPREQPDLLGRGIPADFRVARRPASRPAYRVEVDEASAASSDEQARSLPRAR